MHGEDKIRSYLCPLAWTGVKTDVTLCPESACESTAAINCANRAVFSAGLLAVVSPCGGVASSVLYFGECILNSVVAIRSKSDGRYSWVVVMKL